MSIITFTPHGLSTLLPYRPGDRGAERSYLQRREDQGMQEYGPGILGEVRFARQDGGYYVQLYDREGRPVGKTGLWRTEAKAPEAARRLAAKLAGE